MPSSLEATLTQHLAAQGSSFPLLAAQTGLPESALHQLCASPAAEFLKQLASVADALGVSLRAFLPAGTTQAGLINQAGNGNRQTIKVGKGAARLLAKQLRDCRAECDSLREQLALSTALVASKDETIALLRINPNSPINFPTNP